MSDDHTKQILVARVTAGRFPVKTFTLAEFAAWREAEDQRMQAELDEQSHAFDASRLAILTAQLSAALADDEGAGD